MNANSQKSAKFHFSTFSNHEKRFDERVVGEKRKSGGQKLAKTAPHFERETDRRNRDERQESRRPRAQSPQPRISRISMRNARGTGKVPVLVKNKGLSNQLREKKTGPLSPRAPEKIKKNRAEEMKICGENACLAVFEKRPDSIIRIWTTVETAHRVGDLFSYLANNKKVYHVVDRAELELVSGTEHHGGICMLIKKARPFTLTGYLDIPRRQDCVVVLDGVRNPQNIGAIVRTCAVFGVKGVLIDEPELLNSAAATRVAEGGMEYIHGLQTDNIDTALAALRRAGYQIVHIGTDKRAQTVNQVRLANKAAFVFSEGSTQSLVQKQDLVVNLSPVNPLKNGLNVAVAAGVLLAKRAAK
ncbi:TrmH family RNA methyltransferase [Pasteurellaceae bacterium LIM206]|nr:TrmH family RNA methyltransferase [Pasteurellaceae bacterium LIM206]